MTIHTRIKGLLLAAGLLSLFLPLAAIAKAPSAVTGIKAVKDGSSVVVTWEAVPETDITLYRVYHSQKSILESGGVYDDFVSSDGPATTATITDTAKMRTLFVAVLAVNADGEESEFFVEEASLTIAGNVVPNPFPTVKEESSRAAQRSSVPTKLPVAQPQDPEEPEEPAENPPSWEQPVDDGSLHLLTAETISQTQVKLKFSANPFIEDEAAPSAFLIVDGRGRELPITSIIIENDEILVNTVEQTYGAVYEVRLFDPLRSTQNAPLDPTDRRALFQAGVIGGGPANQGTINPPQNFMPDNPGFTGPIGNLRLDGARRADGSLLVRVTWDTALNANIAQYVVEQSVDGGRTWSEPQALAAPLAGIEIPGVTSPTYSLSLRAMSPYGEISMPIRASLSLGNADQEGFGQGPLQPTRRPITPPPPPPSSSLPPKQKPSTVKETKQKKLTQTGAGVIAVSILIATGGVGLQKMRRKKAA